MKIITWINFAIAFIGAVTIYQHERRYEQDLRNQAGANRLILDVLHGRATLKDAELVFKYKE